MQVSILDSLSVVQNKHGDTMGHAESTAELEKLCKKYGIDPSEDLLNSEDSQNTLDNNGDSDVDLDDISDGSGMLLSIRHLYILVNFFVMIMLPYLGRK